MMKFLAYDLKVAILIAVFYMFYRLLLSRETFHRVNRVVLLATAVASFVLPLCVITFHQTVMVEYTEANVELGPLTMVVENTEPQTPLWQTMVIAVFFIGMTATLAYTIQSVVRVWWLIRHSKQYKQADGTVICVAKGDVSPFSWMHYIVLSQSDYEAQNASILAHERGHIRRHHSMDLILVDTLTALQWFNPAMWMLRQDLRAIHEYEADAAVLSQGINMRQYQYLLIQKAVSHCGYSVANGISHSTLKNRINMMLHKNSSRTSLLKLFVMAPIVGVTLALNAETVNDYVYNEPQTPQKPVVKKGKKDATLKVGEKTIEVKAEKTADAKAEKAAEKQAEPAKTKPFALHAVVDQFGRTVGLSSEGEPDPRQPLEYTIGRIFFDDRVATLEEVKNYKALGYELFEMLYRPNTDGDPKWNYKDKEGILVFKKSAEAPAEQSAPEIVFDVVEQMPEFPGGAEGMMTFLANTVKYPKEAMEKGLEGRVLVRFVIEKDGSVSEPKVVRSPNEELDAEALRVVKAMPKWTPGKQNGRVVRVNYTIPVTFKLQ